MTVAMITPVRALALTVLCLAPGPAYAQPTAPDVVGLVRNSGMAHAIYGWDGTKWAVQLESIPDATEITFVDPTGDRDRDVLASRIEAIPGAYRVPQLRERRDPDEWYRRPLGYFVTRDEAHAPFLAIESPLSLAAWEAALELERPSAGATAPNRLTVSVWEATLGATRIRYFSVDRQADVARGCPPLARFTGWIPEGTDLPEFIGVDVGDCEGKGGWARQPYALLQRDGSLYLLLGLLGWEDDGAELVEVVEGELRVMRFDTGP